MRFLISSVRRQLLAAFMGVSAIFLVAIALGWTGIGAVDAKVRSSANEEHVLEQASGSARDIASSQLATVIDAKHEADHRADVVAFQQIISALKGDATSQSAQQALDSLNSAFGKWQAIDRQVMSSLHGGNLDGAMGLAAGPADQAADQLNKAVSAVSSAISKANSAQASSTANNGRTVMLILAALALAIAAIISSSISRDVSVRVKRLLDAIVDLDSHCLAELEDGLEAIARGDLTREVIVLPITGRIPILKDPPHVQAEAEAMVPIEGKKNSPCRILVVNDDRELRLHSVDLLTSSGYQAEGATDGAAGWEALRTTDYDLVITDNHMPKMTGLEMIEKLHFTQMTIPVIMATGSLPLEEFARRPWLKPDAMLERPFADADLLGTVRNVLDSDDGNDGRKETLLPKHL